MRRHTTPGKRRSHVLEVRVSSPRILWIGFLRWMYRFTKFALFLALLAGVGFGFWKGVLHTFHKNPDFRLAMIDLNDNPVMDAMDFAEIAGIDLAQRPTVFEINIRKVEKTISTHPGVQSATVRRDLPDKLVVRVVPRSPKAWLQFPENQMPAPRGPGGLLVDAKGMFFPCSAALLENTKELPVIRLSADSRAVLKLGAPITGPEIERSFRLLDAAMRADPSANRWIDSLRQANSWSMELVTREGIRATFSFGGHDEQIARFRAALEHSAAKGIAISTINLIPRHNVPFTIRGEMPPPPALPVSMAPTESRSQRDIRALLNRN